LDDLAILAGLPEKGVYSAYTHVEFYQARRRHSALDRNPDAVYFEHASHELAT